MPENMSDQPEREPEEKTAPPFEEESPEVRFAAEAVAKAKVELETAQRLYKQVREKAAKTIVDLREGPVGEALEETRCFVKKYPGLSVVLGTVAGFCLGRLFQKFFRR
ncbi:MAG: hypothetical protein JXB10_08995 [Pirellulales bacterium]|nr:hypothetical protein [Pirellulales bacterium]